MFYEYLFGLILISNTFHTIACFNFDVNAPVFKQISRDVYFGYSIAQHMLKSSRVP